MIVIAMSEERKLIDTQQDVIVTGVGALNVINALKDIARDTPIHNIGYAGSNNIPVGTRCSIGKVKSYHPNVDFKDLEYSLDGNVTCYTSGDFVTKTNIEEPCVFDMELAFILAMGFENVTAEKIVSDILCVKEFDECLKK